MYKVLVIDNFDSFTYNLVHLLEGVGADITVVRNDALQTISSSDCRNILISPGPGLPSEIKNVSEFLKPLLSTHNILGVCLGHQLLGEMFGATLYQTDKVYHGIATPIKILDNDILFKNLPTSFNVGRYHSWMIKDLGEQLTTTALDEENNIMAFKHNANSVYGIQFHPESILSEYGREIISNWLK